MDKIVAIAGLALALGAAVPAGAQVYRWTDERGVVNYSNSPPPKGSNAVQVAEPERPAPATAPPPQEPRSAVRPPERADALRDRVAVLERELETARREQVAAAQDDDERRRKLREQCEQQRRVDCDQLEEQAPVVVVPRARRRNPAIGPTLPVPEKKSPPPTAKYRIDPKK